MICKNCWKIRTAERRGERYGRGLQKPGACVKMRGSVSDVKAAMEAALDVARPLTKIVSHTVIASPSEDTEKAIAMTINK